MSFPCRPSSPAPRSIAALIGLTLVVVCSLASEGTTSSTAVAADASRVEGIETLPPAEVERQLPNANPLNYFLHAARLFKNGENDKAVFWYHAGELRFKFMLLAHPSPPR